VRTAASGLPTAIFELLPMSAFYLVFALNAGSDINVFVGFWGFGEQYVTGCSFSYVLLPKTPKPLCVNCKLVN